MFTAPFNFGSERFTSTLKKSLITHIAFMTLLTFFTGFAVAFMGITMPVHAQSTLLEPENGVEIVRIEIGGARRVGASTVRSRTGLEPGDTVTDLELENTVLKRLFATGLFSDVQVDFEDGVVRINVTENPVVNRVAFEGNSLVKKEILLSEVSLRPRSVYTRKRALVDVERIREIYRRQGRFAAVINAQTIERGDNRVDIVFEIEEGESSKIRKIVFLGNTAFTDTDLQGQIFSREEAWWRFGNVDSYDPARRNADEGLLQSYYHNQGYMDAQVVSSIAEVNLANGQFYLTFTIEEGRRFKVGDVSVASEIAEIDTNRLGRDLPIKSGEFYSLKNLQDSILDIIEMAGEQQFFFVDVRPKVERSVDDDGHMIANIEFTVTEGRRAFVEAINIKGNHRTLDRVIRREIGILEGDPYNAALIRASRQNIMDTGYFKTVKFKVRQGSRPDLVVIDFEVEDQSTGELSFGFGYSTTENFLLSFGIKERNYLGTGRIVDLSSQVSSTRKSVSLGLTEPQLFDRDLLVGGDVFYKNSEQISTYSVNSAGVGARTRYELALKLTQAWRYEYSNEDIFNVADGVTSVQEGSNKRSSLTQTLSWNTLDSTLLPTTGFSTSWSLKWTGPGGDIHLLKNTGRANYYIPFSPEWVMKLSTYAGHVASLDENDVGINDRFFLGGDNLRGFRHAGAGPRDSSTGDSLGGNFTHRLGVEQNFGLGAAKEVGIRGFVFIDAGTLYGVDSHDTDILNSKSYRISAGFGFKWSSPLGPLTFSWAQALKKKDYDVNETFRLSVGNTF